ncbi:MAG: RNase adapter RapZ [Clostridiales bacterium]|jgi:UPF0042 nucleotide-binding protein|nr:RNase adapter RapZ [Clostridiales bacterium]
MDFVIVTGMSGAGKSSTLKFFEDMGFFCVDNLPPSLIMKFVEVCRSPGNDIQKVALGIDCRGGRLFADLRESVRQMDQEEHTFKILFLDASDDVLVNRYKESRRNHPLAGSARIIDGIVKERELLAELKQTSNYIIDTSSLLSRQLKEEIHAIFIDNKSFESLMITVLSFGFKYGLPNDADLVLDVRFIPNPFYLSAMRHKTGADSVVRDFVMGKRETLVFLDKSLDLLKFLIPNYIIEGKNKLVIGIGCTGGRHRSVAIADAICAALRDCGHSAVIAHRDINKDGQ